MEAKSPIFTLKDQLLQGLWLVIAIGLLCVPIFALNFSIYFDPLAGLKGQGYTKKTFQTIRAEVTDKKEVMLVDLQYPPQNTLKLKAIALKMFNLWLEQIALKGDVDTAKVDSFALTLLRNEQELIIEDMTRKANNKIQIPLSELEFLSYWVEKKALPGWSKGVHGYLATVSESGGVDIYLKYQNAQILLAAVTGTLGVLMLLVFFAYRRTKQRQLALLMEKDKKHEEEKRISSAILEGREKGLYQLGQDLHDGPLQVIQRMNKVLEAAHGSIDFTLVKSLQLDAEKVVRDIRDTCNHLTPPILTHFGLDRAIIDELDQVTADLEFHKNLQPEQKRLSQFARLIFFMITKEAINNIINHARATDVWISFEMDDQVAQLTIRDNGIGFDESHAEKAALTGHLGLAGMNERARSIGASFKVHSEKGHGTTIEVILPLPEPKRLGWDF